MKKTGVIIILFLVFATISYSQSATIYDAIKEISDNPIKYTTVIGKNANIEEIKSASELIGFLGIRKSNFDNQINSNANLVVIGVYGNNQKISELIGQKKVNGILIKLVDSNLIVTGSNFNDVDKAVEIIKNYEQNKGQLLRGEFSSTNFLGPIKAIFSNIILVYVIIGLAILGSSTAIVKNKRKKARQKPVSRGPLTIQHPAYFQLKRYVLNSLRTGYNEYQIRDVLLKSGWKKELLDAVFNEVRRF